MDKNIIPRPDGFVVEREYRGHGIYWVHVYGPGNATQRAGRIVAAEAKKWATELDKTAGGWISGGGEFGGKGSWARTSRSYSFT